MNFLKNKKILVTGGTGSFGKEFCSYLLKNHSPKKLIIYSRDELKQFELKKTMDSKVLRFFIGDIRDLPRFNQACCNVDIIVHAAALKQVTAAEYNPFEFVKTNILGAQNIIEAAINNNIKKVIALSTDKAVSPINLYGATKLASDKLFIAANNTVGNKKISFSVVRYGNVVNSRGSFFPEIKNNISKKINITNKDMTRFFITLENSVKFVDDCLNRMVGGEIFIPKINSFKIVDLVKKLSPKSKLNFIGIRPGEKIHELLFSKDDSLNVIEFKKYYIIKPSINMTKKVNYHTNNKKEVGKQLEKNCEYSSENFSILDQRKFNELEI